MIFPVQFTIRIFLNLVYIGRMLKIMDTKIFIIKLTKITVTVSFLDHELSRTFFHCLDRLKKL